MYGRRKIYRRKRSYPRRKYKGRRKTFVKKTVRRMLAVRGLSRPEMKHQRFDIVNQPVTTSLAITGQTLVPMSNGTTGYQDFIGKKITAKSIHIRGMVYNGSNDSNCVRLLVVENLEPMDPNLVLKGGVTLTKGYEIFAVDDIYSLYNDITPRRFRVLWDKTFMLECGQTISGTPGASTQPLRNRQHFSKTIRLGNASVSYADRLGTGLYPVNRDYLYFIVAQTAGMAHTIHIDFGYTDV